METDCKEDGMDTKDSSGDDIACSFCGLVVHKVEHMIQGPGPVYICDQCVACCQEIIQETERQRNTRVPATVNFPCGSMGEAISE